MTRRAAFDLRAIATAVAIVAAVGTILLVALSMTARPPHLRERVAELQTQLTEIEGLLGSPGDADAYPSGALCAKTPGAAAEGIETRLRTGASGAGLKLVKLTAKPASEDQEPARTGAVVIQLVAGGSYGAIINFLGAQATAKPELFVETIDLKSQTSMAEVRLTGRVICSASALH